jgi:hypothetical protein
VREKGLAGADDDTIIAIARKEGGHLSLLIGILRTSCVIHPVSITAYLSSAFTHHC